MMNIRKSSIFGYLICVLSFTVVGICQGKMKMYAFYTPSHEELFSEWFLPSIQDDFDLVIERHEQECPAAFFMTKGWHETMLRKVDIIIRGIRENWNEIFIHSDIDVQFFAPIEEKIRNLMGDNDMLLQLLDPRGIVCPGFLACKGNAKTLELWLEIRKKMVADPRKNDQDYLNDIVRGKNYKGIKWDYLPVEFFSAAALEKKEWFPGKDLKMPESIVLHHATWTAGIPNKIAQLAYVRKRVYETLIEN